VTSAKLKALLAGAAAALGLSSCATPETETPAQAAVAAPSTPLPDALAASVDYADPRLWLCRPGIATDHCKTNLDATIVKADGSLQVERFQPARNPEIDCFFVYPTVSLDPGYLSDWTPDRMEIDDVKLQFARFGAACRTFAPLYRQFTLTALRAASGGAAPAGERPPANIGGYNDVLAAWNWYMANENKGRGVVLVGHSQGAGLIARLLASEIDGKPVQKQLVSALVIGSSIHVPDGQDVGAGPNVSRKVT
jgi:hypothetical protein